MSRAAKDLGKFEREADAELAKRGLFYASLCCADCAVSAVSLLIKKYPTYLTYIRGFKDGAYCIVCHRTEESRNE